MMSFNRPIVFWIALLLVLVSAARQVGELAAPLGSVEHLAESLRDAPVLLVCLARPELLDVRPAWGGGKVNATSVLLEPLSGEQCSRLHFAVSLRP